MARTTSTATASIIRRPPDDAEDTGPPLRRWLARTGRRAEPEGTPSEDFEEGPDEDPVGTTGDDVG